jgi:hypothetical protein
MPFRRSQRIPGGLMPLRLSAAIAAFGPAAPAVAQVIGPGSGRTGASVAALMSLGGVIAGSLALSRARRGSRERNGRDAAVVALVLGIVGPVLAVLHLAASPGAIGSGNGRAGAIVALVLGSIGIVLGQRAIARSSAKA